MTFGEKLKTARLTKNISQMELAEKLGVNRKTIFSYEQSNAFPRRANLLKLAEILDVSVAYLSDTDDMVNHSDSAKDIFIETVINKYGSKGGKEAADMLDRASALFAGGELNDNAQDKFMQSIMEVFLESKAEASAKFAPNSRVKRKKQNTNDI